jgi:transposase-like protein
MVELIKYDKKSGKIISKKIPNTELRFYELEWDYKKSTQILPVLKDKKANKNSYFKMNKSGIVYK